MDFYQPWRERTPTRFSGLTGWVARLAVWVYQLFAPIVRRLPGPIFVAAVCVACSVSWLFAVLLRTGWQIQARAVESGVPADGGVFSIAQIRPVALEIGTGVPAPLLWLFQFSLPRDLVAITGILTFVSVLAMFTIWWERKVSGHIQSRLGPMRVGGWHGWAQSLADGIKLFAKEDLVPGQADRALFRLAPYVTMVPALLAFLALPFGVWAVFRNLDVALLFILAMLGLEVIGVLIAGWASNNKWSLYGAMREACQVVSYEIPLGLSLLIPISVAGSLQLIGPGSISAHQAGGWFQWIAWHSPWTLFALGTYFIASLASCKRAPFDLPEAESELVAGFLTEYSGLRWSFFFFAEYAAMFVVSGVLVLLFLGGPDAPWALAAAAPGDPFHAWANDGTVFARLTYGLFVSGPVWFVLKCMLLIYVQIWLRWTLPRIRIDQLLYACIQVIVPLVMAVLLVHVFWEIALQSSAVFATVAGVISVLLGLIGIVGVVGMLLIAFGAFRDRRVMVGTQAVERPLAGG